MLENYSILEARSQEKNNYASLARTVLFRIDDGIVKFEKNTDLKDRDFVLRSTFTVQDKSPQRSAAESFVLEFLEDGEKHRVSITP